MLVSAVGYAQAPTGSTGECKDGSYTTATSKRGACSGHGGVKDWYSSAAAAAPAAKSSAAPAPAPAAPAAPAAKSAAAPAPAPAAAAAPAAKSAAMPAAGGGPGQVWVNTASKVYHCQGDKWYGKTKQGQYMTEAAAKAAGNHADHGKACT
jgi:pyruvate/2-oxoglutarate dehydrogenase complex dihydrolipoamide acyltransferase (E2) component